MKNLTQTDVIKLQKESIGQEGQAGQDEKHHLLEDFFGLYVKVLNEIKDLSPAFPSSPEPVENFSTEESLVITVNG
jgi:hypothetical protein